MNKLCEKIKTERLLIVPFSQQYLTSRYVGWLNNFELMRYSEQRHKTHTLESCEFYLHSFNNTPNMFWAVEETMNGLGHIGNINAYIDIHNKIADVGILIGETDAQGFGYGYEAFKGIADYIFANLGIRKLTAGTVSANSSMIKLMKKMKMIEDGVRRRHYLIEEKEVDVVHMALFKEDICK
ncbi:MAG: GNAT family N-acetyltransferase [Desulfobacteraceae bacterium]|nr:GNAT family N-acetyltransferase [Desulfobacteraceae bacterium]